MPEFKAGDVVIYDRIGIAIVAEVCGDKVMFQAWTGNEDRALAGEWLHYPRGGSTGLDHCKPHPDPDKIFAAYAASVLLRGFNENA